MANRQITRNAFRQIVSTKLDTSKFTDFGVNELDVGLTSFNQNDYNRVLDRLSDELINPLPDLTPRLVSSNFIDRELLISDFNQVNISFFDEGNTSTFINFGIQARLRYFQNVDPFEAFGNLNQVIPGILQSVAGRPVDHAFNPQNFSNTKSAYYESPLAIGSQLFKEGTENEPFEVEYDNSFLLIESFEKSKDTRLKQELDDSFDVFFDRVTTDIQTGGWALIFSPTVRDKFINAYNNIDFSGGILEVDKDGKVLNIFKLTGNWDDLGNTLKSPGQLDTVNISSAFPNQGTTQNQGTSTTQGQGAGTVILNPGQGSGGFNPNIGSTSGGL